MRDGSRNFRQNCWVGRVCKKGTLSLKYFVYLQVSKRWVRRHFCKIFLGAGIHSLPPPLPPPKSVPPPLADSQDPCDGHFLTIQYHFHLLPFYYYLSFLLVSTLHKHKPKVDPALEISPDRLKPVSTFQSPAGPHCFRIRHRL